MKHGIPKGEALCQSQETASLAGCGTGPTQSKALRCVQAVGSTHGQFIKFYFYLYSHINHVDYFERWDALQERASPNIVDIVEKL